MAPGPGTPRPSRTPSSPPPRRWRWSATPSTSRSPRAPACSWSSGRHPRQRLAATAARLPRLLVVARDHGQRQYRQHRRPRRGPQALLGRQRLVDWHTQTVAKSVLIVAPSIAVDHGTLTITAVGGPEAQSRLMLYWAAAGVVHLGPRDRGQRGRLTRRARRSRPTPTPPTSAMSTPRATWSSTGPPMALPPGTPRRSPATAPARTPDRQQQTSHGSPAPTCCFVAGGVAPQR